MNNEIVEINIIGKEIPYNLRCRTKRILSEGNFIRFFDEITEKYFVINLEQIIYYTVKKIENEENHIPHID